jgi:hypothetical protein
MNWISDTIAIGNYLDATDIALHQAEGIRSLLCLDGKLKSSDAARLGLEAVLAFSLIDGDGNRPEIFEAAVRAVDRLATTKPKLLVQCHAGRSRSVIVVAAHLMRTERIRPQEAMQRIAERREVAITPGIERLLRSAWLLGDD